MSLTPPTRPPASGRSAARIREDVVAHYGFLPPFYVPALETPEILENLWQQTVSAWVNNPLPGIFREKVFAYLSRFCRFPYALVTRACTLRSIGVPAGEILGLLEMPAPREAAHLEGPLTKLAAEPAPMSRWPATGSGLEEGLILCAAAIYLEVPKLELYQSELRRILGPGRHPHLTSLVAYIKTCHLWIEAHPGMSHSGERVVQEHLDALLKEEPRLSQFFRDYPERVRRETQRTSARVAAVQADEERRESDRRFRILADGVRDVLYRVRFQPTPAVEYVSPGIEALTGYAPDEFYADPRLATRIVHPDDRAAAERLRGPGTTNLVNLRWIRRDGTVLWTEHCAAPILDAKGEVVAMEGIARDVTERRRSEERLRLLQGLAEAMNESEDVESALQTALARICAATGWVVGEAWMPTADGSRLECRTVWSRTAEEARALSGANRLLAFAPGQGLPGLCWEKKTALWFRDVMSEPGFIRRDTARQLDLHAAAVIPVFAGSEVAVVLAFFLNRGREEDAGFTQLVSTVAANLGSVVRRKKMEIALRESEERFRSMAQSTRDAVIVADSEGRIAWWNEAAEEMFGWKEKDVMGRSFTVLMPERHIAPVTSGLANARETGEGPLLSKTVDIDAVRRDGAEFPVEASVSSWRAGGQLWFGAIIRDVSERKKVHEEIVRSQRMQAVGEVARGVAHESNNMFTVILGQVIFLLDKMADDDPLRDSIVQVQRAAERAAVLTRQLLLFSRKAVTLPEPVALNAIVLELEPMLERLVGKEIQLRTLLTQGIGNVLVDRSVVEQLLVNLATRARDAILGVGRITIETGDYAWDSEAKDKPAGLPPGRSIGLSVSDSGAPLDPDAFAALRDTSDFRSMTLGAAAIGALARQSGGRLVCLSAPGQGSTLRILWPRVEAAEPAPPPDRPTGSETILVVEDDPLVRAVSVTSLRRCGYNVLETRPGPDPQKTLSAIDDPVDLLLVDVELKGTSGKDYARAGASRWPNAKLLFMSGHTDAVVARHITLGDQTRILLKPFTPDGLARKVREVLDVKAKG